MTKSTRTVLLVVVGLLVLGSLCTVGMGAVLYLAADGLGGDLDWSADEVPERALPDAFGVRLPVKPLRYQGRLSGFQDLSFEVLVELPPSAVEPFLKSNGLTRDLPATLEPETEEALKALEPKLPPLTATRVVLPKALWADGGERNLHRSCVLLEGGGVAWLSLSAFEF